MTRSERQARMQVGVFVAMALLHVGCAEIPMGYEKVKDSSIYRPTNLGVTVKHVEKCGRFLAGLAKLSLSNAPAQTRTSASSIRAHHLEAHSC